MQPTNKIYLIIAAKHFFYRLGVKTMVNVLGIEQELIETDSYEDVKSLLFDDKHKLFLIISEEIFPTLNEFYINELKEINPSCKMLISCDKIPDELTITNCILNSNSQAQVLEIFQDFFFKPDKSENNGNIDKTYLSDRELDVLKLVALGFANKEIADKLFISINTVITHRKNITEKLDIKSIAGLTVYAIMNNLIKPEEVTI